jgi:hypothetical protein
MEIWQIVLIVVGAVFALWVVAWIVNSVASFLYKQQFTRFYCKNCREQFEVSKKQYKERGAGWRTAITICCPHCDHVVAYGDPFQLLR